MDTDHDRRLDLAEFRAALPELRRWGVSISDDDAEEEFHAIKAEGSGSGGLASSALPSSRPASQPAWSKSASKAAGFVLFTNFITWAVQRNLRLDDLNNSSPARRVREDLKARVASI